MNMWVDKPKRIDASKWKGNRREKGEDFFATPHQAILPIIKYIPDNVEVIWEPTAGSGNITKTLEEAGYKVIQTDINTTRQKKGLVDKLDFLQDEPNFHFDAIIFNPPFSYKTEFLEKALTFNKFICFVCPITILETKTRWKMFKENSLSIINLSNRIGYEGKYGRKPFFHSVWVINDNKSSIHFEDLDDYVDSLEQKTIKQFSKEEE